MASSGGALISINGGGTVAKVVAGVAVAWILAVSTSQVATLVTRFTKEEGGVLSGRVTEHTDLEGHPVMVERVESLEKSVKVQLGQVQRDVDRILRILEER